MKNMFKRLILLILVVLILAGSSDRPVFKGYFQNADYSNPKLFITPGLQTSADDYIKNIATGFNNKKDFTTIQEIFKWLKDNLKYIDGEKFERTGNEIIGTKTFTGCTDMGLAFAAFTRAKGIPSVFIQTGRIDWIRKAAANAPGTNSIIGHILVEVLLNDNKWYLVDSTAGKLYYNYDKNNFSLPDGYYVFSKSTEVFDTGVTNEAQNHDIMTSIFRNFDVNKYNNPKYDFMDLHSGTIHKSQDFIENASGKQ